MVLVYIFTLVVMMCCTYILPWKQSLNPPLPIFLPNVKSWYGISKPVGESSSKNKRENSFEFKSVRSSCRWSVSVSINWKSDNEPSLGVDGAGIGLVWSFYSIQS